MTDIILIGERINSTNKEVRHLLEERHEGELVRMAREQAQGGASFIDINASMLMAGEEPALRWAARCITAEIDVGVSLDSPSPDVMLSVLPDIEGPAMLNSFTCDAESIERAVAATQSGASVIIMLKSAEGIPATIEGRLRLAARFAAAAANVPSSMIYIDPILSPLATSASGMDTVLGTIAALEREYPDFHRIGGLSNVSYGLPKRRMFNRTFCAMAISHGLDALICDTTDPQLMETIAASEALVGLDPGCRRFLKSYRQKKRR